MLYDYRVSGMRFKSVHHIRHHAVINHFGWSHRESKITNLCSAHKVVEKDTFVPPQYFAFGCDWYVKRLSFKVKWKYKWVIVDNNGRMVRWITGKSAGKVRRFSTPAHAIAAAEETMRRRYKIGRSSRSA